MNKSGKGSGPFGFSIGMTYDEVKAACNGVEPEHIRDDRYYADYRTGEIKEILKKIPEFEILAMYTKRREKTDKQSWLNIFVRKNPL